MLTGMRNRTSGSAGRQPGAPQERGFTLIELMITMVVFIVITGSIAALVGKSQSIFRTEQGVSEMDQNARLMMDFLTRDIQQARQSAAGLGSTFRPVFSSTGPDGKTDQITIVSSDTETKIPSAALPLIPASTRPFSAYDHYVELLPNGVGNVDLAQVAASITPNEELLLSSNLRDGSVQFDIVKVKSAAVSTTGTIGLSFEPVPNAGLQSEVPFGTTYNNGSFIARPVLVKKYFVDRTTDAAHPVFSLATNDLPPIPIARNIVAFQLRYLELRDGDVQGNWVKDQTISHLYKTLAVEVTLTARTEIAGDRGAERLVTLASVIRPRFQPSAAGNGSGSPWGNSSGLPGGGGAAGGGNGSGGGPGDGIGITTSGGGGGAGYGFGPGSGGAGGASGGANSGSGWKYDSKQVGKPPKLGESINNDLDPNQDQNQQP
jgi:prepilin-type N-terminal cleavage/methylation domain-containing protein